MVKYLAIVALMASACGGTDEHARTVVTAHTCAWAAACDQVVDPVGLAGQSIAAANCAGHLGAYSTTGCDPEWATTTHPAGTLPAWLAGAALTSPGAVWTSAVP